MKKAKIRRTILLLLVSLFLAQIAAPALSVPAYASAPSEQTSVTEDELTDPTKMPPPEETGSEKSAPTDDPPADKAPEESDKANEKSGTRYYSNNPDDFVIENGVLVEYRGSDTHITIPSTVEKIGQHVFSDKTFIEWVVIPPSVIEIDTSAFLRCTGLEGVTFSEGLEIIGNSAFQQCTNFQVASLPLSLAEIGDHAFWDCTSLQALYFKPDTYLYINQRAFENCAINELTLPADTWYIGKNAFKNNTSLTALNLPEGVRNVDDNAFRGCTSLIEVDLPGSLEIVPRGMFAECTSLETVVMRPGIIEIKGYTNDYYPGAFHGCTKLKSVTLPSSSYELGRYAFFNTPSLLSVIIPPSVTIMGERAFDEGQHLLIKGRIGSRAQSFAAENNNRFQGTLPPVDWINVKRLTGNRLQITWAPVPDATNYKVRVKAGSGNYVDIYRKVTNLTIDVQPYTLYTILVYGLASVGGVTIASEDSPTRRIVSTVPPPPTNFVGSSPSPTRMRLTWTPESEAEFYIISRRVGNRYVQVAKMTGTSRVFTNTKLTPYTLYDYRIESQRTVDGVTVRSAPVYRKNVRTQFLFGPTDIKTTANPGRQIRITWTRPTHYTGFRIFRKDLTTGQWSFVASTKNYFYTDTGLIAGRRYQYQIDTYLVDDTLTVYSKRSSSYYVTARP